MYFEAKNHTSAISVIICTMSSRWAVSRRVYSNETWSETLDKNGISLGKDFAFTKEEKTLN